jgi:hypothetical protein
MGMTTPEDPRLVLLIS